MVEIDIVIVNWNSGELLRACVRSLVDAAAAAPAFRVIVIDNGSADGSAEALPDAPFLTVVRNGANRGFAAACNQGARMGSAPFVLFLNPDTQVTDAALRSALGFMRSPAAADVGVCGVQLLDGSGEVTRSCARRPTPGRAVAAILGLDRIVPRLVPPHMMTDWDHASARYVDQVIGAFFFVRRPLFERLEGFDERFFVYYEEVDFSTRAAALGFRSYYLTSASAIHTGAGTTDRVRAFRQFLVARSRIAYARKHFGRVAAGVHTLATLLVEPLVRTAYFAARADTRSVRETFEAAALLWRDRADGAPAQPHAGGRAALAPDSPAGAA